MTTTHATGIEPIPVTNSCSRPFVQARLAGTVDRMAQLVGPVAAAAYDEHEDEHAGGPVEMNTVAMATTRRRIANRRNNSGGACEED